MAVKPFLGCKMGYPQYCILERLKAAAAAYPDKVLYNDTSDTVTFLQADVLSDRIGSFILAKGVKNRPVVVMTGRNVLTPVCYLGVVKAACYYAPLDHTVPPVRISQVLSVIGADTMIADADTAQLAAKLGFKGSVYMLEDMIKAEPDPGLLEGAWEGLTEDHPLYVIFTSGSSGKPKGVMTSHRALDCYISAVNKVLRLEESDILGNQSPLDYIAAIRDIYLPLWSGCSTVILPKSSFAIPTELFKLLNTYGVTVLCWSVSGVELCAKLNAFASGKPQHLKTVIFSGSVINSRYLRAWQDALPEVRFINQYGPTETTASCTYYEVPAPVEADTVLPIGKPYENYKIYLIRDDGTEAPAGELGEICVGGPGLALCYYGAKELTDKSFVQNPLNSRFKEILYKTGDLGCIGADGLLYFHGRKDRQIKHMGHRIELDEIESAAKAVEGVDSAYAMYDVNKELLWLFYTGSAATRDIVLYFRANMPAYMVPRRLVPLQSLPILPNGKTDAQALKQYFI